MGPCLLRRGSCPAMAVWFLVFWSFWFLFLVSVFGFWFPSALNARARMHLVLKRLAIVAIVVALVACHGSSSPTDPAASLPHGRLSGTVTIGPNCPGPTTTAACPTQPDAYAASKILVYDATKTKLLL